MLGRLGWDAVPIDQPLPMIASLAIAVARRSGAHGMIRYPDGKILVGIENPSTRLADVERALRIAPGVTVKTI